MRAALAAVSRQRIRGALNVGTSKYANVEGILEEKARITGFF